MFTVIWLGKLVSMLDFLEIGETDFLSDSIAHSNEFLMVPFKYKMVHVFVL